MPRNLDLYSLLSRVEALEKALLDPPGECAPKLDPNDPLSEVVPYEHAATDVSRYHHTEVIQRLQRMDEPRTIRNLLREYMRDSVCGTRYTIKSPSTGATYRIYRLETVSLKNPSGREHEHLYNTPDFPVFCAASITKLVGWTIRNEYKVLDAFVDCGHKYIITEVL